VLLDISFKEAPIFYSKSFRFKTLYAEIAAFGGLMNFFIRISNVMLGGFHGFAQKNSMIKRLYSSKKEKKD
jgi:hypothetical protein